MSVGEIRVCSSAIYEPGIGDVRDWKSAIYELFLEKKNLIGDVRTMLIEC
nr:hypothetical protein [Pseudomonas syringae pv. actinidiae]